MKLHLTVAVIAPGCVVAGWWQVTRALAGNELSWAYSVEWPVFSLVAVAAWWLLIHEDPEAFRARRARTDHERRVADANTGSAPSPTMSRPVVRHATRLAVGLGAQLVLGLLALALVPFDRPVGWVPSSGEVVYLLHAIFGFWLLAGSVVFVLQTRSAGRLVRTVAWLGLAGVALAGAGGLLTVDRSLVRFLGILLMFAGSSLAGFSYLTPRLLRTEAPSGAPNAATAETAS